MSQSYTPTYERSHALVVGINAYSALPTLFTAVHDAEGVTQNLADRLGFEVTLLRDSEATRDNILSSIQNFTRTSINDRVLIYFAGHGMTRSTTSGDPVGLLVPYGVESGQYEQAIEMDYLVDRSKYIPAKHILFVLDACFSGLSVTRSVGGSDNLLQDLMMRRAVQAIAAGQEDQMVADTFGAGGHSIFTGVLLELLDQRTSLLTGNELGLHLQRQVGRHTHSRQTPHFGHLLGSQGGDFVFWAEEAVVELPAEVRAAVDSSQAWMRQGVINELSRLMRSSNPEMAALARQVLVQLAETDDSISVRAAAQGAIDDRRYVSDLTSEEVRPPAESEKQAAASPGYDYGQSETSVIPEEQQRVVSTSDHEAERVTAPSRRERRQKSKREKPSESRTSAPYLLGKLFRRDRWSIRRIAGVVVLTLVFTVGAGALVEARWAGEWLAVFFFGLVASFIVSEVTLKLKEKQDAPGANTPFLHRWWRVGAGVVGALIAILTLDESFGLIALPLGIVGIEHIRHRRWLRGISFLVVALGWIVAQIDVSTGEDLVYVLLPIVLFASPLLIIWSIVDAIRDKYV